MAAVLRNVILLLMVAALPAKLEPDWLPEGVLDIDDEDSDVTMLNIDDEDSDVTMLMQTEATIDKKLQKHDHAKVEGLDQDVDEDVTILMQTTAHVGDRRGRGRFDWGFVTRVALTLLVILPALLMYMGAPEVVQAWSLVLGNGALRGTGAPHNGQGRSLAASATQNTTSGDHQPISEAVLDALLAEPPCCDGAAPGLQTGFKLIPQEPDAKMKEDAKVAEESVAKTKGAELVSDDVLDAMLSEPSEEELMQPRLQKGFSMIPGRPSAEAAVKGNEAPTVGALQSKGKATAAKKDSKIDTTSNDAFASALLDAIGKEGGPWNEGFSRVQTGAAKIISGSTEATM